MQFDWWTFAFQAVNVLVLMWLLGRFLFRPIAAIIAQREAETRQTLDAAAEAQQQAQAARAAADTERDKIAAERLSLIQTAQEEAEAQRKRILDEARHDAEHLTQAITADAHRRQDDDQQDRDRRTVALAVVIARRLLDNLPADGRVTGYVERLKTALSTLTPAQRQAFAEDLDTLRFIAARDLAPAELDQAVAALHATFDTTTRPPVDVDPNLIAGLELHGRHSILHNSLGHDLTRIAKALTENADV